jgi:ammonium transporter, Amt family
MQCGFALLESGGISLKNTKNILLKNVMNTCIGALCWWALGNALAYGSCGANSNGFIGTQGFFSTDSRLTNNPFYWSGETCVAAGHPGCAHHQ